MFSRNKEKDKQKYRKFGKLKVRCYNCQDYGHYSRECPDPRKETKKEHEILQLAKVDVDDVPRKTYLMMVYTNEPHWVHNCIVTFERFLKEENYMVLGFDPDYTDELVGHDQKAIVA
ncbi:Anthranilate N-benzoyltransferase protein 2 [Hordeum vulgare]|nr:Anthranilate N-benzoyltransferase protein 2 [Hordeum vulgare]